MVLRIRYGVECMRMYGPSSIKFKSVLELVWVMKRHWGFKFVVSLPGVPAI